MKSLRFVACGAGFWAPFQLAAWRELPGVECVAVCDPVSARAERLAGATGIPRVYRDAEEMLERERPDFVDIIAGPAAHRPLVELAARHQMPVICQKPLAESREDGRAMMVACESAGVPLLVHENWRWQPPLRALAQVLRAGEIGEPFRARIDFITSFPVFENQPFLASLPRFIIADIGVHLLDVARFLFGEAGDVCARTRRVNPVIRGEDVATVMTRHGDCTVVTNMSYASRTEHERFPETFVFVEGREGSVELGPGCLLRVTTRAGTRLLPCPPRVYPWADPEYAVVHSGMVECQRNLLAALRGEGSAETEGADNLRTLELVFASYESAESGRVVPLPAPAAPRTVDPVSHFPA